MSPRKLTLDAIAERPELASLMTDDELPRIIAELALVWAVVAQRMRGGATARLARAGNVVTETAHGSADATSSTR